MPPVPTPLVLTDRSYARIRDLVRVYFGIHLDHGKQALVVNRLQSHVLGMGLDSYEAFLNHVEYDLSGEALDVLAGLISTNYTYFYREESHFEFFRSEVLPELEARLTSDATTDLRVWCAAASTGEEAYSIVMTMLDYFGPRYARLDAGLLATDLSLKALRQATEGVYTTEQIQRVPSDLRRRYFCPLEGGNWAVIPEVRAEVIFRKFNLITAPFPFKKPFDAIFCRNVLIYFDPEARRRLVTALYQYTAPGGYLFIGHSETIGTNAVGYQLVRPAVYRRPEPNDAPRR